jgi:hypothetical protein
MAWTNNQHKQRHRQTQRKIERDIESGRSYGWKEKKARREADLQGLLPEVL